MMPPPPISIRPASPAADDGLRLLRNFDSQLSWLSSIGSGAQWGDTPRSDQEDQRVKYRGKVERSAQGWDDGSNAYSRDWVRAYIAEVEVSREELEVSSEELLELATTATTATSSGGGGSESTDTNDVVRLPVAGMVLQGQSAEYVRDIVPENDDEDPFVYVVYLMSDRRTAPYGKGAGAALIAHAKNEARSLGIRRLCLDCWRGNDDKLVHYYEKQGFRVMGNFEVEAEKRGRWPGAVLEMRL